MVRCARWRGMAICPWLYARARRDKAQHLAVPIAEMPLFGRGIAFPNDALVGYLHPLRRAWDLGPPVASPDFCPSRGAIAGRLAILRFPAVAARGIGTGLMPFGI